MDKTITCVDVVTTPVPESAKLLFHPLARELDARRDAAEKSLAALEDVLDRLHAVVYPFIRFPNGEPLPWPVATANDPLEIRCRRCLEKMHDMRQAVAILSQPPDKGDENPDGIH